MTARKEMSYAEKGKEEVIVGSRYLSGTSRHFLTANMGVTEQITSGGSETSWKVLRVF